MGSSQSASHVAVEGTERRRRSPSKMAPSCRLSARSSVGTVAWGLGFPTWASLSQSG